MNSGRFRELGRDIRLKWECAEQCRVRSGGQLEFLIEIDINGGKRYNEISLMSTEEEKWLDSLPTCKV